MQKKNTVSERSPLWTRLLRARYLIYALVVLALLVFRVIPSLQSRLSELRPSPGLVEEHLVIGGLDTAPELIPRVVNYYQKLYPKLALQTRPGGTVTGLEDLLNHRADVAFLSRPPSAMEDSVAHAAGESLLVLPIALAGTLVLASASSGPESLSVRALRDILSGASSRGTGRTYAPDPSLGLWGALARQLDLPEEGTPGIIWLRDDREVVQAVVMDPGSLGLASSFKVNPAGEPGCRTVRITADPTTAAADPGLAQIAGGKYPLYHHLFAAYRAQPGVQAAAFVTFVHGDKGQALIRNGGFLPAREIAREIQLAQGPVGMPR